MEKGRMINAKAMWAANSEIQNVKKREEFCCDRRRLHIMENIHTDTTRFTENNHVTIYYIPIGSNI